MSLDSRNHELDARHRRTFRRALIASAVLHALVFAIWGTGRPIPESPFSAAGERRGDARAARGGGLVAFELRTPSYDIPRPPPPIFVDGPALLELPPEPERVIEEIPAIALGDPGATMGKNGAADGPGTETGTGRGDGGTEEDGRFRVVPPRPRGLILPPGDRPTSVRGKEIEVWVFVSAAGRVIADSTRLDPSTGDRRFDRRLREHAAGWVFEPALRHGKPIPEWFRYTIVM